MKKHVLTAIVASAALICALAPTFAAAQAAEPSFRFVLTAGLTAGGDKLADISYDNGGSSSIKGGGLVQIGAGLQYKQPTSKFSLLATLNYHVDNSTAKNGDVRFDRMPIELLGFYHISDKWRIGGGWRHTTNSRYKQSIDDKPKVTVDFKDSDGAILQVAYGTDRFWGGLRYVNESLTPDTITGTAISVGRTPRTIVQSFGSDTKKYDGSHIGLFGYVTF